MGELGSFVWFIPVKAGAGRFNLIGECHGELHQSPGFPRAQRIPLARPAKVRSGVMGQRTNEIVDFFDFMGTPIPWRRCDR